MLAAFTVFSAVAGFASSLSVKRLFALAFRLAVFTILAALFMLTALGYPAAAALLYSRG